MLFAMICKDKPDSLQIRMENRSAHLNYLADAGDRIKVAGPLLSPGEHAKPIGSMLILDAASEAAVKLFAENDPYASAELFESVEIHPWMGILGEWKPGS